MTHVEESSKRTGSAFSSASVSTADAELNWPRVVAVTVDATVALMAVTTPFGASDPEPEMNAVPSAKSTASPMSGGRSASHPESWKIS